MDQIVCDVVQHRVLLHCTFLVLCTTILCQLVLMCMHLEFAAVPSLDCLLDSFIP